MRIGDLVTWSHSNLANQNDLFIVVKVRGSLGDLVICQNISTGTRTEWVFAGSWRLV